MMMPTKKAKSLKQGDRIALGQGETPPSGTVDFVYRCHNQVHILVHRDGEHESKGECRSFAKDDLISLAK